MLVTQKFGPEILVNTADVGDQASATIAGFPDGRFLVAWKDSEPVGGGPSGSSIKGQLFDSSGAKIGSEILVQASIAGDQAFPAAPAAAALTNRTFALIWSQFGVVGQLLDADGEKIGSEFSAAPSFVYPSRTALTALAGGGFVLSWTEGGFGVVRARIFDANGIATGSPFDLSGGVNNPPDLVEINPDIAAVPDGGFVATWTQYAALTELSQHTMLQFFDPSGAKIGATKEIANYLGAQSDPQIASIGQDRLALVYSEAPYPANMYTGYLQILDASGAPVGDRIQLFTTPGSFTDAIDTSLVGGDFVVTWTSRNAQGPDSDGHSVWAQVFDPDGHRIGDQLLVNTETRNDQSIAMSAALPDQSFAVVWTDESGAGTELGNSVKLQLFALANSIEGTPDGDFLDGTAGADAIDGLAGPDRLTGREGNDFLHGGPGSDYLDGGPGIDTAIFDLNRTAYTVYTYFDPFGTGGYVTFITDPQTADGNAFVSVEHVRFESVDYSHIGPQQNNISNVSGGGFDDVVFQSAGTGQLIFAGMQDGAFSGWSPISSPGAGWKAVAAGSAMDRARVFAQNFDDAGGPWDGAVWAYRTPGPLPSSSEVATGLPAAWKLVGAADVQGDGYGDPILQDSDNGSLYFIDAHSSNFSAPTLIYDHLTPNWIVVGAGDINGDNFADIVIQDETTGTVYFADMAGGIFNAWGVVSVGLTPDWRVRAVADVNGDGYADVITQDQVTGTTYFADMRGGVFDHWGIVTVGVDATWVAGGAGDVDNDGDRDVLFQHTTDGLTYYARMGSAGFEAWGTVAPASTDWVLL